MVNLTLTCIEDSAKVACLNLVEAILTITSMLTVILIIILGNLLVIVTVYRDRKLRAQRQNWLIVSLAVADLLVGLLVTPLTLIYEIIGEWKMGMVLCEMWLALDVLFVTASILHICAISLDRYFSVTSPLTYPAKRTPTRMFLYIGVSWVVSLLICLPPIFGWRPERKPGECSVSTEIGYVLYSSLGSFYIPVVILIIVYAKIYSITIKHSRQRLKETERLDQTLHSMTAISMKNGGKPSSPSTVQQYIELEQMEDNSDPNDDDIVRKRDPSEVLGNNNREAIGKVCWQLRRLSEELPKNPKNGTAKTMQISLDINGIGRKLSQHSMCPSLSTTTTPPQSKSEDRAAEKRKRKLKQKERQATLLLGIILSAFILSWLPFFVMYVIGAFGYEAPAVVFKFFFWLGYCNSGINPVIYTVFNREFKRGLCKQLHKFERFIRPVSEFYKS
ncbi:hypothetical protein WR25_15643 [Diploscapter pachys]|uniref:G-protein coupled receptors family 1 profile domain-containing protein n=1 Tax=Diploscapter pachys TaxID=2018661 RepID=A0A2A2KUS5_9BILA|nr:hypothetical protein WR25_15643 [Diploscapter pachys]